MLETNTDTVRRYGPPQRNRMHNRRKSGDRFEKVNYSYGTDGEKSRAFYPTGFPATDHWEAGSNNIQNENSNIGLIPLDGCCTSEAAQLLNERWVAAMHSCNDLAVELSGDCMFMSGGTMIQRDQFCILELVALHGVTLNFLIRWTFLQSSGVQCIPNPALFQ